MLGTREQNARLQSDFYRDQYRKMLRWLFYCMVIMFILIGAIIYYVLFQQPLKYYANTTEGIILPMPQ